LFLLPPLVSEPWPRPGFDHFSFVDFRYRKEGLFFRVSYQVGTWKLLTMVTSFMLAFIPAFIGMTPTVFTLIH
jgi:hypothetical protein